MAEETKTLDISLLREDERALVAESYRPCVESLLLAERLVEAREKVEHVEAKMERALAAVAHFTLRDNESRSALAVERQKVAEARAFIAASNHLPTCNEMAPVCANCGTLVTIHKDFAYRKGCTEYVPKGCTCGRDRAIAALRGPQPTQPKETE